MGNKNSASVPISAEGAIGHSKSTGAAKLVQRPPASTFKCMFCGPGGAGKTFLLFSLKFPEDHDIATLMRPTMGKNI